VGPRAGLANVENRKFLTLSGLELRPLGVQPVASRYPVYVYTLLKELLLFYFYMSQGVSWR
jgi:hypothetical protein